MGLLNLFVIGFCLGVTFADDAFVVEVNEDFNTEVPHDKHIPKESGASGPELINKVVNAIKAAENGEAEPALSLDRYFNNMPDDFMYAHCAVQPNPAEENLTDFIWGSIDFKQAVNSEDKIEIRIDITGFNTHDNNTSHGFHIHENGDLSHGCESAGEDYDPFGVVHGGAANDTETFRHFGDLGFITEDKEGASKSVKRDQLVSLLGPFSVLGRSVVIHKKSDDLGRGLDESSLLNGNTGSRVGCCTIGLSNGAKFLDKAWNDLWMEIEGIKLPDAIKEEDYNSVDAM